MQVEEQGPGAFCRGESFLPGRIMLKGRSQMLHQNLQLDNDDQEKKMV